MDGNEAGPGDWERAPAPEDWQAVVDAAFQGIWTLDDRAVTTWVNRRMAGLLGSEPQEIVGLPLEAFLFPEDLDKSDPWQFKNFRVV